MECPFYVGQRVVAHVPVQSPRAIAEGLREGNVYTISWIGVQRGYLRESTTPTEVVVVRLKEIKATPYPNCPEGAGWWWRMFRPATDIGSLQALLNTTKTPELEEA